MGKSTETVITSACQAAPPTTTTQRGPLATYGLGTTGGAIGGN